MIKASSYTLCMMFCVAVGHPFTALAQLDDIARAIDDKNPFCDTPFVPSRKPDGFDMSNEVIGECNADPKVICNGSFFVLTAPGAPGTFRLVEYSVRGTHGGYVRVFDKDQYSMENAQNIQPMVPAYDPWERRPHRGSDVKVTSCRIYKLEKNKSCFYGEHWDGEKCAPKGEPSSTTNRQPTQAEDLFSAALAKSPEQLREESAAARTRIDSNTSPSTGSGDSTAGMQVLGALLGGYVAGRTGNTALLEAFTGQTPGASMESIGQGVSGGGAVASSGGAGSAEQCTRLGQQFSSELQRASMPSNTCQKMKGQLAVYESYRPRVMQVCAGQPGYQTTMNDFNTNIPRYKKYMAQTGCR